MIDRFIKNIELNKLFSKEDDLLLALSGGADSVALFHLLIEGGFSFSAAHVNYGLRGKESDADEAFVKGLCDHYGVELKLKKVDPSYWKQGMNIQNEARNIRYAFFNAFKPALLLTAHHKDDNTETILMNITRGTGLRGLLGMKILANGICRPLLRFEKSELLNYLETNKYAWREDRSNLTDKYKRNRFRNEIIPLLLEENPSLNLAIERLVDNVNTVAIQKERDFNSFLKSLVKKDEDQVRISKGRPDLLDQHLFDLLYDFGFNRDQVLGIITSLDKVGKTFMSSTHTLFIDRKDLVLVEDIKSVDHVFTIYEHTTAMLSPLKLRFSKSRVTTIIPDKNSAQLDFDKLTFPITLRNWRAGDRIFPLGMKGSKKISDILIDEKVSRADKENTYVLVSNDEIVWLPGRVLSDKAKITSQTKQVYRIEMI